MALVKCGECGEQVSSKATACPKCGNPMKGKTRSGGVGTGTGCLIVVLAGFAMMYLLGNGVDTRNSAPARAQQHALCSTSKIAITSLEARFVDKCRASECWHMEGVATLNNGCPNPVGVQVKITGLDAAGKPRATRELWPASTRNIPPGEFTFSLDQWLGHDPAIKSFTLEPVDVRTW